MANVTRTTVWQVGAKLKSTDLNNEFNNLLNAMAIVDADISGSASISLSKINLGISGSLVGTSDTQTLTNKTITKPTLQAFVQNVTTYTPGAGGTATLDLSNANLHFVTMPAGNVTLAITNATIGQCFIVRILQDAVGGRTVTWFSTIHWAGGTVPVLTAGASHWDTFGLIVTASGVYDGYIIGQNLS